MKKIAIACLVAMPFAAVADIVVNAPSQNGGWAYLYDPNNGSIWDQKQFNGGTVTLDTSALVAGTSRWAVDITYDAAKRWQSRAYWNTSGSSYSAGQTWNGVNRTVTMVSGQIVSRSYVTTPGARQISVTYSGANSGLSLESLNNDTYALDAYLQVYRPTTEADDFYSPSMVKKWDPTTLSLEYTFSVAASSADVSYDLITLNKLDGSFSAQYIGKWNGSSYDLAFTSFDDPGDSAYWTTFDRDGTGNGVVNNGDGSVTFTAFSTSTSELLDMVPYYVFMDHSEIYDDASTPGSLSYGRDGGLSLVNPDYFIIPEPTVASLVLCSGVLMLLGRRICRR